MKPLGMKELQTGESGTVSSVPMAARNGGRNADKKKRGAHLGILVVSLFFLFPSFAWGKAEVFGLRHWTAPEHTRIVLDLSEPVYYDLFELREPNRLVIDLKGARLSLNKSEIPINDQVVSKVRWGCFSPTTLRVVIDLLQPAETKVYTLKKLEDKPDRLVIDILRSDLEEKEKEKRTAFDKKTSGTFVIIIDPGHGGEDPGAVGPSGSEEKSVVLHVSKKLRDLLNNEAGFRAFLTREKDYFIPLRQRWRIAKEYNADVFISIHANAGFNKTKSGAEVYCLSSGGAGQEAARILADKENSSDLIGGVELAGCSAEVDCILLSMTQTKAINDGVILGKLALQELERVNRVNFAAPLQAGFAVLKAPDIPSMLVEVGYISNPHEAQLLGSDQFQSKLAAALKESVIRFAQGAKRGLTKPAASVNPE